MTKPATFPGFDTNVTNITTPASGLLDDGYALDDIPTSSNFNWLFYWISQWLEYLGHSEHTRSLSPHSATFVSNWAQSASGFILSTGSGTAFQALPLHIGDRPRDINIRLAGDAAADVTIVVSLLEADNTQVALASLTVTNPGVSWQNARINFAADTGATALGVDGSFDFTRAAGSFIADGFCVGMTITATGFTNAGNNSTRVIAAVTATNITCTSTTGMVSEASGGNEQLVATPPTLGTGESMAIYFGANAAGIAISTATMAYDNGSIL